VLEEQLLDPSRHNRQDFISGVAELDGYLRRFAVQQSKKGVGVVRVLIESEEPSKILGYYSLSAAQVDVSQLDEKARRKLPSYPIPCFRMGRLAVHLDCQRRGIGKSLVACAVERCLEARKHVAAYALLVDAKNKQAANFYQHYGFSPCQDNPMMLYLPLGRSSGTHA